MEYMCRTLQKEPCINETRNQKISSGSPKPRKHLKFWRRDSPPPQLGFSLAWEIISFCILTLANMQGAQFSLKSRMVQNAVFVTNLNPSTNLKVETLSRKVNIWLLWFSPDFSSKTCYEKNSKLSLTTALQWFHTFKDLDGLTARWLEQLAAFEHEIVHRSGKALDRRTLCPGFPVKTPARTRRLQLCPMQKQSTQRKLTTTQVNRKAKPSSHGQRKKQSPTIGSKRSQNCNNSISIREMINKREVNRVLISCTQSAKQRNQRNSI